MLALMPYLLPLSPSPALSDPERCRKILTKIDTPARLHAQHALSVADPRIIDVIAANVIRCAYYIEQGRLLETLTEMGGTGIVAWAAGLGKLGGIGERFLPALPLDPTSIRRRERTEKLKVVRWRGSIAEPPKNAKEYGQRIHLL